MKILVIRICGMISGAEIYNLVLLKELIKYEELNFSFITNLKQFASRLSQLISKTICMPMVAGEVGTKKDLLISLLRLPNYWLRYFINIYKLEEGSRFGLICLQSMTEKIFLTPVLRFFGYNVIWIEHGPLYASQTSRIIKWLHRKASLFSRRIIAVSQDTKTDLVDGGVLPEKVEVIYIGVDTERLKPLEDSERIGIRNKMHIQNESKVIGFLGTVTREKGIEDFLDISVKLVDGGENFEFLMIGGGPELLWMKKRVKFLRLDKLYHFVGFVDDTKKYLGIIDIFLFPTLHQEGISMAILEAQSMEKVVFTRDIGGNSEIIRNKENGYLYAQWNNETISRDIINFFSDPRVLVKVGKEARENVVTRYNIKDQARKFYRLFSSA